MVGNTTFHQFRGFCGNPPLLFSRSDIWVVYKQSAKLYGFKTISEKYRCYDFSDPQANTPFSDILWQRVSLTDFENSLNRWMGAFPVNLRQDMTVFLR